MKEFPRFKFEPESQQEREMEEAKRVKVEILLAQRAEKTPDRQPTVTITEFVRGGGAAALRRHREKPIFMTRGSGKQRQVYKVCWIPSTEPAPVKPFCFVEHMIGNDSLPESFCIRNAQKRHFALAESTPHLGDAVPKTPLALEQDKPKTGKTSVSKPRKKARKESPGMVQLFKALREVTKKR